MATLLAQWDTDDRDMLLEDVCKLMGRDYAKELKVAINDAEQETKNKHESRERRWEDEARKQMKYALTCYYILPILHPGLDWDNEDSVTTVISDAETRHIIARKIGVKGYRSIMEREVLATSAVKGRAVALKKKLGKGSKQTGEALMYKYFKRKNRSFRAKDTVAGRLLKAAYEQTRAKNHVIAQCELLAVNESAGENDFELIIGHPLTKNAIKSAAKGIRFEIANSKLEYQAVEGKKPAKTKEEAQTTAT